MTPSELPNMSRSVNKTKQKKNGTDEINARSENLVTPKPPVVHYTHQGNTIHVTFFYFCVSYRFTLLFETKKKRFLMPLQTFFVVFKIVFPFTLGFILVLQFLGIAKNEMRNRFAQIRSNNNGRAKIDIFFLLQTHSFVYTCLISKKIDFYLYNQQFFFYFGRG